MSIWYSVLANGHYVTAYGNWGWNPGAKGDRLIFRSNTEAKILEHLIQGASIVEETPHQILNDFIQDVHQCYAAYMGEPASRLGSHIPKEGLILWEFKRGHHQPVESLSLNLRSQVVLFCSKEMVCFTEGGVWGGSVPDMAEARERAIAGLVNAVAGKARNLLPAIREV